MSYADNCARVYVAYSKRAHLMPPGNSPNNRAARALCGLSPQLFDCWFGTGSQKEHEKAARMDLCGNCREVLAVKDAERVSR